LKPISGDEVLNLHEYEIARPDFRQRVIERKKRRRVALGPIMTLVFENRDTVLFQIQEMLRVERIVRPEKVQEELDVYNELLPDAGEVAATLFIEVTEAASVQPVLDSLIGLEEAGRLRFVISKKEYPARFAAGQSRKDRIPAVHYVRFAVGDQGRADLAIGEPAVLEVDHGDYHAEAPLGAETVKELLEDLKG
jgi:uncharacterized protein DUF3501